MTIEDDPGIREFLDSFQKIVEELAPCPWCKQTPKFYKTKSCQNYDSTGKKYDTLVNLPEEIVACQNTHCACRPRISRVNMTDAKDLWNMCATDKIALR